MPTWGALLTELMELGQEAQARAQAGNPPKPGDASPFDLLRRKYLRRLHEATERAVIVYGSAWQEGRASAAEPRSVSIDSQDVLGFMEACSNIKERELDLVLHSPGGSAEAADSIVEYLRSRFDHIRAVIPLAAMSAATMLALACDEIVMGTHSQLGPIDPQFTIHMPEGPRTAPGQTILDQFDIAKEECAKNPAALSAWLPILRSYAPGLIAQCHAQRQLSVDLVSKWLARSMLASADNPDANAKKVAEWFADFATFKSHGRRVGVEEVEALGLPVTRLESNDDLQDAVLSVHHALMLTFSNTLSNKIIENHRGRAWVLSQPQQPALTLQLPVPGAPPGGPGPQQMPPGVPQLPQGPSRQQRRDQDKQERRRRKRG